MISMSIFIKNKCLVIFGFLLCLGTQVLLADAMRPNIHFLVMDSDHIVIGTVVKIEREDVESGFAIIQVENRLKTTINEPAKEMIIKGGYQEDSPFLDLKINTKFLMFIFDKDKLTIPYSAVQIEENGDISSYIITDVFNAGPKTINDMVARIKTIMSDSYTKTLLEQLDDEQTEELRNKGVEELQKSFIIESLGFMKDKHAFNRLDNLARREDDKNSSSRRAAMISLSRIDPNRSIPIFVDIATFSNKADIVQLACDLIAQNPHSEPNDFKRLLLCCQQWLSKYMRNYDTFTSLLQATGSMDIATPEFKELLLDDIKYGRGNGQIVSMNVASCLKIKEAIPLIEDILINGENENIKTSAKIALMNFKLDTEKTEGMR
jgi:hypothetical protein